MNNPSMDILEEADLVDIEVSLDGRSAILKFKDDQRQLVTVGQAKASALVPLNQTIEGSFWEIHFTDGSILEMVDEKLLFDYKDDLVRATALIMTRYRHI